MLRNQKTGSQITSHSQFLLMYECPSFPDEWEGAVATAFNALSAAQARARSSFLRERASLEGFNWHQAGTVGPSFSNAEDGEALNWYSLVDLYLPMLGRAWVYEMEESGWSIIKPGSCNRDRMDQTKSLWQKEVDRIQASGQASEPSDFMQMMGYRIRKTLRTCTKKHLLINELIQSDGYTRSVYAKELSEWESREVAHTVGERLKLLDEPSVSESVARL